MKFSLPLTCVLLSICLSSWAQEESAIRVEVLAKTTTSWDGRALSKYPGGTPEINILRIIIPGNTTLPWHQHPVINAGILMSGNLTVITREGDQLNLTAGDTIVETVDTWHQGINEHPEAAEIIVFYAGVLDEPLTIQEQ